MHPSRSGSYHSSCASVDALGAFIIGIVAGILVDVVVELLDKKLHLDDPVGAVGVHMANGIWGTLAVGLFATGKGEGAFVDGSALAGLFYGGGFKLLGIQALGICCIVAYVVVAMTIVFQIIKHTIGLRVSAEEKFTVWMLLNMVYHQHMQTLCQQHLLTMVKLQKKLTLRVLSLLT